MKAAAVWLLGTPFDFSFNFCASAVKDFWHQTVWCGPAYTSILPPSVSFNPSLIHRFLLDIFHSSPVQIFTFCSSVVRFSIIFPFVSSFQDIDFVPEFTDSISKLFLHQRISIEQMIWKTHKVGPLVRCTGPKVFCMLFVFYEQFLYHRKYCPLGHICTVSNVLDTLFGFRASSGKTLIQWFWTDHTKGRTGIKSNLKIKVTF